MSTALTGAEVECGIAGSLLASLSAGARHEQPYRNWRLSNLFPDTVARELAELPQRGRLLRCPELVVAHATSSGLSGRPYAARTAVS